MKSGTNQSTNLFLSGGGEMARLILNYEWASTPVGPLAQWPQSLCTTLGIMLQSTLPMFLWWGNDQRQFYNDALRPSLVRQGKHPTALGQPGAVCWPDKWSTLKPFIDQVLVGNEKKRSHTDLITFFTSAVGDEFELADCSLVWDEAGRVSGVLVICKEAPSVDKFPDKQLLTQLAIEQSQVGFWERDPVTNSMQWDDRCKEIFGLPPSHRVYFDQFMGLIHPDDLVRFRQVIQWNLKAGGQFDLTFRINTANDGQLRWIRATGWFFVNSLGEPDRIRGIVQQVAPEQRNYSQVERRFQSLFETAPVAISVLRGPEFVIELINEQMCAIVGRTKEKMLGKPMFEELAESAKQGYEELLLGVMQTGVPFVGNELPATVLRNGRPQKIYTNSTFAPRYDLDNQIIGITVVVVEVTEQVRTRHRVEASSARLEQIFQYAPTAIGIFRGPTFIVDLANPTLCALWGRTEEQVLSKPIFDAIPEAQGQGFEEILTKVLLTEQLFKGEEYPVTLNRNGQLETVYFELIYASFPETADGEKRIIMTANDITKMRQVRQQTEQLLAQERELNELKSNFVTLASHEFRTPMATILSSATLIGGYTSPHDGDNRERHVQRIKSSVYHLTGLLNDFLVISQLEKKVLMGRAHRLMLVVFCDELIDEMQGQLKSGQRIIYRHQEGPAVVTTDELMVKNILINLLSNASKYSNEGKNIELTTTIQNDHLQISIKDWGIGIPEADQDKLFINFFRAGNATHVQGTGLGLYIVKRSVDLLGGSINFTSQPKLGTTFTVQLPLSHLPA